MEKIIQIAVFICISFNVFAQYTVGTKIITYTDAARSNRAVGVEFRYPGTNTTLANGQFPFVIFAHGFQMDEVPYYPYADSLAKQGYIVGLLTTETSLSPSHANFAQDLIFVHDKLILESNTNTGSPFYQKVIPKGALGGHSMGGGSTVLSAQYGNPATCYFTFAAAVTNPSSTTAAPSMTKPYLSFAGSRDCIAPIATHQQLMYNASGSPCKFLINITDALHCQFGNGNFQCNFGEGFSGCASSPLTRQQQINKTLYHLVPFLDYYLKGDCNAWTLFETRYAANTVDAKQRNCTNTVPSNPFISGNNYFCNGSSTTLTAQPASFNYLWSNNSMADTLSVSIAGNYSVVVGNGVCSLPVVSVSVAENFSPATPSVVTAPDTVCSGISAVNISVVNDPSATTYNWTLPSGWSITSGNNTNSIQTNSGTSGGTISVTAQNNCGTTSPSSKQIVVVASNLGVPGNITGADTVCSSQSEGYSIAPVAGAVSYQWNFPSGWTISLGNNSNTIVADAGASSGTISVTAVNSCGQSVPSLFPVFVHTVPVLGVISGADTVCLNNNIPLSFSLSSANDADNITWAVTNPWSIISGQGTLLVSVNNSNSEGTISVNATNQCGISSTVTFTAFYADTPQITITQQGAVLHADAANAVSYQWYDAGGLINGATAADYTPTASGNYTVSVTNQSGCSSQSSEFSFIFTGIETQPDKNYFTLYPNPTDNGKVFLLANNDLIGTPFTIFNAIGDCVFKSEVRNLKTEISFIDLARGFYLLRMESRFQPCCKKIVIE